MCYNNENIVFNFAKLLLRHIIIPFLKKIIFYFFKYNELFNFKNYAITNFMNFMQLQTL